MPAPSGEGNDGCTDWWRDLSGDQSQSAGEELAVKAKAWVGDRGKPGGSETVNVERVDGEIAGVTVTRKGKRVARGFIQLRYPTASLPDIDAADWRKDGAVVAITLGYPPPTNDEPGFGPPTYVVVLPLDGSTANAPAPPSDRQQAKALNADGMAALNAKNLDKAQALFQQAIEKSDFSFLLAYYNLACVASLRKDRKTSIDALKKLAHSDAKEAKAYLAKGLTDHDLDWIAQDPEGAKILKRNVKQ
jgi:hypothetical protein